jgi:hypothetical protein
MYQRIGGKAVPIFTVDTCELTAMAVGTSYLSKGTESHFSTVKRKATNSSETSAPIHKNIRILPFKTGQIARRNQEMILFPTDFGRLNAHS